MHASSFQTSCNALPDHFVVLGGKGIRISFRGLKGRFAWMKRKEVGITLLSGAAAEWKFLHPDTDQIANHWENQQVDRDAGCSIESHLPLFTQKAQVTTGFGMASTADLVLMRIVAPQSLHLAQSVAQVLLIGDIRDGAVTQPRSENDVMPLRHSNLEPIIAAMKNALETPFSTAQLPEILGSSVRQMERKFKALVGRSPASFFRFLRLRRAKALVEQTVLPITEISVACGFGSPSSFAQKIHPGIRDLPFQTASSTDRRPAMALLFGIAVHFLSEDGTCPTGVEFTARSDLRFGVALLGADQPGVIDRAEPDPTFDEAVVLLNHVVIRHE